MRGHTAGLCVGLIGLGVLSIASYPAFPTTGIDPARSARATDDAAAFATFAVRWAATSTAEATSSARPRSRVIRQRDFGDDWPFTVDGGVVTCRGHAVGVGVVRFITNGTVYSINGATKLTGSNDFPPVDAAMADSADIKEIWAANPAIPGLRMDLGPVLDRGLAMCGATGSAR